MPNEFHDRKPGEMGLGDTKIKTTGLENVKSPVEGGSDGFSSVDLPAGGWTSKSFDKDLLKKRG